MIQGKFFSGNDDLTEIRNIRRVVFQEELGIKKEIEEDGLDNLCMHVLAYDNRVPVATGRIYYDGWEFVISKVAVLKEHRRKMYGDFIVRMLIDKAMMAGALEIKLKSPKDCVEFFKRIGFENKNLPEGEMVLDTANIHKCCDCNH